MQVPARDLTSAQWAGCGRGLLVGVLTVAYFAYVFRLRSPDPWTAGLGDWHDPYFINALLEHWYRSVTRLLPPASPPIYFPVKGTLGYSHGLIPFAPFYIPLRLVLHPFQADTFALLAAMEAGTICLYVPVRKAGLSVIEAVMVTTLFVAVYVALGRRVVAPRK